MNIYRNNTLERGVETMQGYLVSALIFALLVAIFAIQNTTVVVINFLMWKFHTSLVLVILGSALLGALCIFLLGSFKNFGAWRKQRELEGKNRHLTNQVNELEAELKELRERMENLNFVNQNSSADEKDEQIDQATNKEV